MEIKKEDEKIKINLSPTSINMYYKSPLLFYLTYVAKVPDDTPVPVCYGLSGNIVHDCLEKYAAGEITQDDAYLYLIQQWLEKNLHIYKDINNQVLNQTEYLMAVGRGMRIVEDHEERVCEEVFSFPFKENEHFKIGIKGIVDLQAKQKFSKQPVIIDYKTSNSVSTGKEFDRQALFYNYLVHKQKGILPTSTEFHYLKLGVSKRYSFTLIDLQAFEEELLAITEEIIKYGLDISNYPAGEVDDLFNSKKQACLNELARRGAPPGTTLLQKRSF